MTSRDEEIKAANIVKVDEVAFTSPEINRAAEYAAYQLHEFINFVQELDTELTITEATILTASVIEELPALFKSNPAIIESIKKNAAFIRSKRNVERNTTYK
jgi:hypothetical protein